MNNQTLKSNPKGKNLRPKTTSKKDQ